MASIASVRSKTARMAGCATCAAAMPQWKGVLPIKLRRDPCGCAVTGGAVCAKQAGVKRRLGMTGNTCRRQPFELSAAMTALTSHAHVRARQREVAAAVVEGRVFPVGRIVAGGAVRSKLTAVFVILFVA